MTVGDVWVGRGPRVERRVGIARFIAALLLLVALGMWGTGQWYAAAAPPSATFTNAPGSPFTAGLGTGPLFTAVGDYNGDGKLDLAVTNFGSNNVSILLGNGTGGFTPASGSPVAVGANPVGIVAGDFNGDGKLDIAVANSVGNNVSILLGNGMGGFTPASGSPVTVGSSPSSIAVGDYNGDGKLDLAVTNFGSNNVSILLGNGTGGFAPASGSPIAVGAGPYGITTGDFNGDGKLDLAVTNNAGNTVSVLLGNGMGGFTPASGSPITVGGTGPSGLLPGT